MGRRMTSVLVVLCALALMSACCWKAHHRTARVEPVQIVIDSDESDGRVERKGDWPLGVGGGDWNDGCLFAFQGKGECRFIWRPELPASGKYRVSVWFGGDPNSDHATDSPFTVHYDGGKTTHKIDQTRSSDGWRVLGVYPFAAGKSGCLELSNDANGNVVADAVKFESVD